MQTPYCYLHNAQNNNWINTYLSEEWILPVHLTPLLGCWLPPYSRRSSLNCLTFVQSQASKNWCTDLLFSFQKSQDASCLNKLLQALPSAWNINHINSHLCWPNPLLLEWLAVSHPDSMSIPRKDFPGWPDTFSVLSISASWFLSCCCCFEFSYLLIGFFVTKL